MSHEQSGSDVVLRSRIPPPMQSGSARSCIVGLSGFGQMSEGSGDIAGKAGGTLQGILKINYLPFNKIYNIKG